MPSSDPNRPLWLKRLLQIGLILLALFVLLRFARFAGRAGVAVFGMLRRLLAFVVHALAGLRGTPWLGLLFVVALVITVLWFRRVKGRRGGK
mgnify:CR=1 FL=1